MNRDVIALFYFCGKPDHVPIRQANAAVAHSVSDRTRIVGAVNADAFFVKRDPHHAYRISRPGWEHVEIAAAFAVLEHFLVVTKPGQFGDASHLPVTDR